MATTENRSGIFDTSAPLGKILAITDGLSNTMMFAESAGRPTEWRAGVRHTILITNINHDGNWAGGNAPYLGVFNASGTGPGDVGVNANNFQGMYGFHTGGANAAFADGSVRFVSARTAIRPFLAMLTRANGEVNTD
jgi:prepilin-type processing-associated H-X9-DG protein